MYFQGLGMKTDSHKHMDVSGLSSLLSNTYLSKFNFQNNQFHNSTLGRNLKSPNQLMNSVDIMNFVPSFSPQHSPQLSGFSKTMKEVNVKKIDTYSQFTSMNISYLVGGFVGSKSQVGYTSMQGDRFLIWDIVWQKLIEMMGSDKQVDFERTNQTPHNKNTSLAGEKGKPVPKQTEKQTYADVTRLKLPCSSSFRGKEIKPIIKIVNNTTLKPHKQRKKQYSVASNDFKGKSDFMRSEKKTPQETSSFSSTCWSNTRKKLHKKGIEKSNRREKREAARDGIDFVYQDLGRTSKIGKRTSINISDKIMESLKLKARKQSEAAKNSGCHLEMKESVTTCNTFLNGNRPSSENIFRRTVFNKEKGCGTHTLSCNSKSDTENILKPRINSESSVESEDSFIVFEYDDADNLSSSSEESYSCCEADIDSDNVENVGKPHNSMHKQCNPQKCSKSIRPSNDSRVVDSCRCEKLWKGFSCNRNRSKEMPFFHNVPYTLKTQHSPKPGKDFVFLDSLSKYRRNSECSIESEDSFIVFDSASSEDSLSSSSDSDEDGGDNVHIFYNGEDDSDDQIDSSAFSPSDGRRSYLNEINDRWKMTYPPAKKQRWKNDDKKVHFPPDGQLAKVKMMVTWDFALRAARAGPWEELARDTMRFNNRIRCIGEILEPVLDTSHRMKIWNERFADEDC